MFAACDFNGLSVESRKKNLMRSATPRRKGEVICTGIRAQHSCAIFPKVFFVRDINLRGDRQENEFKTLAVESTFCNVDGTESWTLRMSI